MEYRKYGETYYLRMDRGDEIIEEILKVCKKEEIRSCIFSGIGGCRNADIQTFIPELGEFESHPISGMLELASMNGNVVMEEDGTYCHHTHAVFAYKEGSEHIVIAGHLKSTEVLYTAEIELRPVIGGQITKKFDPETGTGFWNFT